MSKLKKLIRDSEKAKKELYPATVRLPEHIHTFIEDLAEHLCISKQELLLELIQEGVDQVEKLLQAEVNDSEVLIDKSDSIKFYVLNTNKKHDINDQEEMISKGIAAAFYSPWKFNIDRIKKGDVVYLYENGVGIIAHGVGTGILAKKDRYDDKDECHYQSLSDFKVLQKPLSASQVKKILGRNVVFLRTMTYLPDGQKIINHLNHE